MKTSHTEGFMKSVGSENRVVTTHYLSRVVYLLDNGFKLRGKDLRGENREVQQYIRQWNHLKLINGTLYRTVTLEGQPIRQLVLPNSYRTLLVPFLS